MMLWSVALLAIAAQQPAREFPVGELKVVVTRTGVLRITAPDGSRADAAVVLWHDDWQFVHQNYGGARTVEPAEGGLRILGRLTDREGAKVMALTETIRPTDNGLAMTYDLRPMEQAKIVRGPLLQIAVDRRAFSGRRQFMPPGIASRIPAHTSAGTSEYWLEVSDGLALVVGLPRAAAVAAQPMGDKYVTRITLPLDGGAGRVEVSLRARRMPEKLPGEVAGDSRPLAIEDVKPSHAQVPRYGLFEARIDLAATYTNPFDPDQIAVDAQFRAPSGRTVTVPCFYMVDFQRRVVGDVEELAAGKGSWRVRFTPDEVGRWEFSITARDKSGQVRWKGGAVDVKPSHRPGFVRVSLRSPRYLALSTGEGLFPIGHNMPTYHVARFLPERELAKMRDGGEDYNRWWMYSQQLGLEWEHAPGWYRQAAAWRLDYLLRLADEMGFWFMLCFDTHQDFRGSKPWEGWPNNPYNAALGGPCQKPADFFASPEARALYKKRLRYIVARWGWSTHILCWELGNEFEGWPNTPAADLLAWHREMSDYLRSIDPYKHLITTSFWTAAGREEIWRLKNIDIVQTHHYANRKVDMARLVAADCHEKFDKYRKPHIYGEVGLHARFEYEPQDTEGYWLHNVIWAALMCGAASTAMSWWHESYINRYGLYRVYRGLARFVAGVPLARYRWRPAQVASVRWLRPPDMPPRDVVVPAVFGWGKPEVTRFEVSPDGQVNDPAQVPSLLQGRGHADVRAPVTFVVNYPQAGKFAVHVDRVSSAGLVRIFIDGQLAREFNLPCGEGLGKGSVWRQQWKLWETVYDTDLTVDVPAGRHEIRVENDGADWVRVSQYRFVGALDPRIPDHLVLGMRSSRMLIAWVRNADFTWFKAIAGAVLPRPPAAVTFADVRPGRYRVELWDTWEGKVVSSTTITAQRGELTIELPGLEKDVAMKATRME